ncbi:hypothetical protein CC85DRAFT_290798 [Cutaneotrichosporon oleaginosum]|uniref:SGNH hydrolase-type esterase domain-containing protein n=1 Tax=Cutaneotrichosporon oleaginosum TaxID=879819 RepID=A0A0J0XUG4_9TREE|nr:uncharacterized protein CC85DRAFT_290798 [Cutaneotrichosporon oleaginosum]KLT44746.1 hypothetical protein CC85DRAFT_290798 [Cutaneotrichosporon oleaginosum]TXT07732.1 hypothetical protein COLE_04656 [Cutaneotrichosporon oleaginosum]
MTIELALQLPSSRRARLGLYAALVASWTVIIALLLSALEHPDGVSGVARYVAAAVRPSIDEVTKAKLARLDQLEVEAGAYVVSHGRCDASLSAQLEELDARWGRTALDMSVGYEGSGLRVRRVVQKLLAGQRVSITVLGGSITFGHSMAEGDRPWPLLLAEQLRSAFPNADIYLENNAIGATGSDYFDACYPHHTAEGTDLFLFEFAVNDAIIEMAAEHVLDTIWHAEHLVRSVGHTHPDAAIIFLSAWQKPQLYMTGADAHATVSEYYDIPRVSSRTFLYRYMLQHRDELGDHYTPTDNYSHQNQKGHQYLADIMFRYILHQACRVQGAGDFAEDLVRAPVSEPLSGFRGSQLPSAYDPWSLPLLRIRQKIDAQETLPDAKPFCSSVRVRVADGTKHGTPQLLPSFNDGFEQFEWNDKWFWKSDKAGSKITFPGITVVDGTISLYFLRSWGHDMGDLLCWVNDDEKDAALLTGLWGFVSVGARQLVKQDLKPGTYSLTCRSQKAKGEDGKPGGARTQIIAVMAT